MVKLRLGIVLVVVLAMSLAGAVAPAQEAQAATTTVVSLTFDDGNVDQQIAPAILAAHGMQGTFYVNSGPIGTPGKFTWSQVRDLATGNEVAGHTIDHVDLTTVSTAEAQRQVCDDRLALFNHGLRPTSFAYPFGASNATLAGIVHNCGYNSGRRAWGLWSTANCPVGCPYAETIPPANVYGIRTSDNVSTDMSLSTVEGFVTQAESHGGGWVNLVFHHFCDGCDYYSLTESNFTALLDWLQPRAAQGTIVRTVQQVIGGGVVPPPGGYDTTAPTSSIVCNGAPCSTGWYSTSVQATLSATDTGGSGLDVIRYTTDGSTPTAASTPYTGPFAVSQTTTVKYRAWDNAGNVEATNSQLISFDSTAPTSSITCNGAACSSGLYAGSVSVALSASDGGGSGVAQLRYTTDGSDPTTSSASYTGPFSVSQTTTVKYRAWDNAGNVEATNSQLISFDSTAPTSSITCNGAACSSGLYAGSVSVALSASDGGGSGVAQLRYTTDGSDPTTSSASYTGPFSVSQTTTVKYRAWDNAGNVEATNSQLISFDSTAPTSSITCNGAACSSGLYAGSVSVALSASDGGGSGVAQLRYTTDGSDPTTSSASYTGPFSVSQTTTVKYRAWDNAGNVEATNSQLISFDSTAPTSSITCNGAACSSGLYAGSVSVALSASDGGGSGVAQLRYTTDGSDPTTSSASYTGPFSVSQTTTVKYRAWDNAGNVEATNSQLISFDSTAPTSSITCNGAACSSGLYAGSVSVASVGRRWSAVRGSAQIRYTTDGSDPTTSSASYTGPFSVSQTTTVKYRAWDDAGNVEATNSQLISFDSTAPTSSITCNGAACSSGLYAGSVSVALSAVDAGSGVSVIRYTTNGSDPTTSSASYTGPFSVSQTTTVKYRAWDNAGNVEATNSQLISFDSTAPISSIACNNTSCSTGWYAGTVLVSLSAVDAGSGVSVIRYTTNGSDPTTASTIYLGAFSVLQTTTVKFRAWDNAGNVEPTNSQLIRIDTTPPTSSITCNDISCSTGWYRATVKVTIASTDGGSGVAAIRYTTNGLDPTTTSPLYTVPFSVSQTTTVKYRAWDNLGNIESTKSQTIRLDSLAPTVAITSPTAGSTVTGNVKIDASATDGGSGVASVKFYVDGQLDATVTALPYRDNWNSKKFSKGQHTLTAVAVDAAGNAATSAAVTVTVN